VKVYILSAIANVVEHIYNPYSGHIYIYYGEERPERRSTLDRLLAIDALILDDHTLSPQYDRSDPSPVTPRSRHTMISKGLKTANLFYFLQFFVQDKYSLRFTSRLQNR
jgi:hypothetical protein